LPLRGKAYPAVSSIGHLLRNSTTQPLSVGVELHRDEAEGTEQVLSLLLVLASISCGLIGEEEVDGSLDVIVVAEISAQRITLTLT